MLPKSPIIVLKNLFSGKTEIDKATLIYYLYLQVSVGCAGSPCSFGCTTSGASYTCGCPQGYQRIGQGHCLSTITPAYSSYSSQDIGDVPVYPIDERFNTATNDKLITTEGCFSCRVSQYSICLFVLNLNLTTVFFLEMIKLAVFTGNLIKLIV